MNQPGSLLEGALTHSIIGAFFEVATVLGYGLLETAYCAALGDELTRRGHRVEREVMAIVRYKGTEIARQRLDFVIDGKVILEVKATEQLSRFAPRQLLSYLSATKYEVGLLLHFGPDAKFHRMVKSNKEAVLRETSPRSAKLRD